jgi:3-oxoacyl-[acyl-carrier-protein] synthase II
LTRRRVVVTGLGIVSPVGSTVESAWANILAGRSGIAPITRFDVSRFSTRFGGAVADFDVDQYLSSKDARKMDAFMHYGFAASRQAIEDAGIEVSPDNAHRVGVAVGAGIGGIETIERAFRTYLEAEESPRKISPFFIPGSIINMISGHVSIHYGMTGPNLSLVTACTTATHSIGIAARTIQYGDADVMVAGGAEMATTALGWADSARRGRCPSVTMTRRAPAGPGTGTGTASCWATARAAWCSRSTSTPGRGGRRSTASWSGSA